MVHQDHNNWLLRCMVDDWPQKAHWPLATTCRQASPLSACSQGRFYVDCDQSSLPQKNPPTKKRKTGSVLVLQAEGFSHHKGHSRLHGHGPWAPPCMRARGSREKQFSPTVLSQSTALTHTRTPTNTVKNLSEPAISHRQIK